MSARLDPPINDSLPPSSPTHGDQTIFEPMSEPKARSVLYRLIEAGQLTRKALLVPLLERGLEAGDDAVLFVLHNRLGATEADLSAEIGVAGEAFDTRIDRLIERDLIARTAIGPELSAGLALTERGERLRAVLAETWAELEAALLGELKPKKRRRLRKTLGRFVELLRL